MTAAVVVTFNRLPLLKRCIKALKEQTQALDSIIIINNGCTDGTHDWLALQVDLIVVNQANKGSAGGQVSGMKKALEVGAEWIWCMDDDAEPEPDALFQLFHCNPDPNNLYCSLPLNVKNRSDIVFGINSPSGYYSELQQVEQKHLVEETNALPFLGLFISARCIEEIGMPLEKIFIRGDDEEYSQRATMKYRKKLYYVTKSVILHPFEVPVSASFLGIKFTYFDYNHVKTYYIVRNFVYINRLFKQHKKGAFGKSVFLFTRTLFVSFFYANGDNIKKAKYTIIGFYHGWIGRLGSL